jgi:integrase
MFFLKDKNKDNTTIEAIVRYKGQRFKFSTGEKVITIYWNSGKSRCQEVRKFPDGALINQRLEILENHAKKVLNNFAIKFKVPTPQEFKEALKNETFGVVEEVQVISFVAFAKNLKETCSKTPGTKITYQSTIKWLEAFEAHTGRTLIFSDMNNDFYKQFYTFVYESKKVNSPNYFGTLIKNIKVFMNVAREEGLHDVNTHNSSSFKKFDIDVDNIYLTVEELIKIHNLPITEELVNTHYKFIKPESVQRTMRTLELTRGRFLIGAFTALRVSDFSRIEELNIKNNFIRIRTDKNDYPVVIPVHWVVREILDKGFNLADKIDDHTINTHVKKLCRSAGITGSVVLARFETGKRTEVVKEKCDWVTTHTARRSGATNMYKAGIPSISIMKITGHHTEKSFLKYIKITQEENAELLSKHPFFMKPESK